MRHLLQNYGLVGAVCMVLLISSCKDPVPAPTVSINQSATGKTVAFTGVGTDVETWLWDFGDGETSTEQNPVHTYASSGYYTITVTVTNETGTASAELELGVDLGDFVLLTGGINDADGKTWIVSGIHSDFDRYVYADELLEVTPEMAYGAAGIELPLTAGILAQGAGFPEVYKQKFTFMADGSYSIAVNDSAFASKSYVEQNSIGIQSTNGTGDAWGICVSKFTAPSGATFTYTPSKDLTVSTFDPATQTAADITYTGVSTISFSDGAYVGMLSAHTEVIIEDIQETTMRVIIFYHDAFPLLGAAVYPAANSAMVLTLELVP